MKRRAFIATLFGSMTLAAPFARARKHATVIIHNDSGFPIDFAVDRETDAIHITVRDTSSGPIARFILDDGTIMKSNGMSSLIDWGSQ
jgi:hypothetical protein